MRKRAWYKDLPRPENPDVQSAERTNQAKNFAGGLQTGLSHLLEEEQKHSMGRQEKLSVPPSLTHLLLSFPRWASSRKWEKYFPLKQEIHFGYYKKHCTFAWRDKRTTCSLRENRHLWDLCNVSSENPCPNAVGIKSVDDRMQSLLQIMPMQSRTNTSKKEKEAINIVPPTSIGIGITVPA